MSRVLVRNPPHPRDPASWAAWREEQTRDLSPAEAAPLVALADRKIALLTRAREAGAIHPADQAADPSGRTAE